MSTSLEQLKASGTVVVADTGDFECMSLFMNPGIVNCDC